ncbi:MAG TPA: acyl-CoA dehydrogenase family protein [Parachlamydiaceae bacterium]|nr:acyl-CoA dehydrogenase family protein [Parachlamydiaceae bacterium]
MNFSLTEDQKNTAERCRQFAETEIAHEIRALEENLELRKKVFQKMALEGFFTLALSGNKSKRDTIGYLLGLNAIAKVDAGMGVAMAVTNMVAEAIERFGSDEQWTEYLPRIANGTCVPLSFALTEKQAGSDVKAIQTSFEMDSEDPEVIVLNGSKQYITNADIAGVVIVIAKGSWDGEEGISAFLVDHGVKGFSVVKKEDKLGLLTANLVSLKFENCRIAKKSILGKPGEGLKIALSSLDSGRLGIAAQSLGIAEAAFEAALLFSKERQQFGHAIGENQVIAFKLADMRVKLDAGRLLMLKAAWLKDENVGYSMEAAEAKLYCSESCNEIAGEALQIHGGCGYIKDYPVEKYFRDARVTTIYEGTSEIQRIVIARNL